MSLCLPHHPLKHHWKPGCKPIRPSDFPPHWPPGSISKENLSPDGSKHFLTLCLETPSSPNSWERQDRRGLSKCMHTAKQPTSPPALRRPDKWKDYINMEKNHSFQTSTFMLAFFVVFGFLQWNYIHEPWFPSPRHLPSGLFRHHQWFLLCFTSSSCFTLL